MEKNNTKWFHLHAKSKQQSKHRYRDRLMATREEESLGVGKMDQEDQCMMMTPTRPWWWSLYFIYRFQVLVLCTWYLPNVLDQLYLKKISLIIANAFIWGSLKLTLLFGSMQDIFNVFLMSLNNL